MKTFKTFLAEQRGGGTPSLPFIQQLAKIGRGKLRQVRNTIPDTIGPFSGRANVVTRSQQNKLNTINNNQAAAARAKQVAKRALEFKRRKHHAALNTAKGKVEDAFRTLMLRPTGTGTAGAKKAIIAGSGAGAGGAATNAYQSGTDSLASAFQKVPGLPGPQPAKFTDPVFGIEFGGRESQGAYASALAKSLPVVGPTVATLTGDAAAGTSKGAKQLTGDELRALVNTCSTCISSGSSTLFLTNASFTSSPIKSRKDSVLLET